jgi:hypothetical protein
MVRITLAPISQHDFKTLTLRLASGPAFQARLDLFDTLAHLTFLNPRNLTASEHLDLENQIISLYPQVKEVNIMNYPTFADTLYSYVDINISEVFETYEDENLSTNYHIEFELPDGLNAGFIDFDIIDDEPHAAYINMVESKFPLDFSTVSSLKNKIKNIVPGIIIFRGIRVSGAKALQQDKNRWQNIKMQEVADTLYSYAWPEPPSDYPGKYLGTQVESAQLTLLDMDDNLYDINQTLRLFDIWINTASEEDNINRLDKFDAILNNMQSVIRTNFPDKPPFSLSVLLNKKKAEVLVGIAKTQAKLDQVRNRFGFADILEDCYKFVYPEFDRGRVELDMDA